MSEGGEPMPQRFLGTRKGLVDAEGCVPAAEDKKDTTLPR